jgi:hypothetical protein
MRDRQTDRWILGVNRERQVRLAREMEREREREREREKERERESQREDWDRQ